MSLSRRGFLIGGACCAAPASAAFSGLTLAAAPGDRRVVVILLRGGMDGLGLVQPYGDKHLKALRPTLAIPEGAGLRDLDGFFGLSYADTKGGAFLLDLWERGDLGFVQAVATPYRGARSHFDGQDLLETGGATLGAYRSGWLNRLVRAQGLNAVTIAPNAMLLGAGDEPLPSWSPGTWLNDRDVSTDLLLKLYENDPAMRMAALEALRLSGVGEMEEAERLHVRSARFAAQSLNEDARIAAFSIGGWDTHTTERAALSRAVGAFAASIATLKEGLGANWDNTAVIAVTEFGRTAHENGGGGTDHGTGGMAILAGGAVRGGRVVGEWPGLHERDLYEGRDLMPTGDVRAYIAALFKDMMGVETAALEQDVFGDLSLDIHPALLK